MSETEIFEPCLVRKFKLGVEGGRGGGGMAPLAPVSALKFRQMLWSWNFIQW